ncbi:hypothetical protein PMAYCL1PPCAC_28183, partial [Pristionchus mayeri]
SSTEYTMAFYDHAKDSWTKCQNLPSTRSRNGVAIVGTQIFAIGGYDGMNRLKSVDVYDAMADKWEKTADMNTERSAMGTGVIDGKIYAAGGYNGQALNSMEMLNPADAEPAWTLMAAMTHHRCAPASCLLNGKLYGTVDYVDGSSFLREAERYDPMTNTWTSIMQTNERR